MKIKRKLIIWSVPVAIIGIVVSSVVVFGLQVRQAELGHDLIEAINSGANANATDKPFTKTMIQERTNCET